jgi:heptosyltransferase I
MTKRILIVRLSAIGDCILSVPVLNSLRRNFPGSRIGWVTERAPAQLLQGHPALDDLFVTSKQTFKSPRQLLALGSKLRAWKPDITIDLQGLTKSSLLARLSGAKDRLGFHRGLFDGRELSTFFNNRLFACESDHMVDRGLDLLKLLDVNDTKVEFELPESEIDAAFANQTLRARQLEGRFAIINVGAGWVSKIWPSERYACVARHLGRHWGLTSLVVWSGEAERTQALQIVAESQGSATLAPSTTLTQLGSLVRRASLFVGSDTGPMHLSVALGTPTVGMIGPMPIDRVQPYGPNNIGVQNVVLKKSSDRKTDCEPMHSIFSEHVINACDQLLNRSTLAKVG